MWATVGLVFGPWLIGVILTFLVLLIMDSNDSEVVDKYSDGEWLAIFVFWPVFWLKAIGIGIVRLCKNFWGALFK